MNPRIRSVIITGSVLVFLLVFFIIIYNENVGGPATCQGPHNQLRRPVIPSVISQSYSGPYPAHSGIDYAGPAGSKVRAVAKGKVVVVRKLTTSYGKHVIIQHACGKRSLYAHLRSIRVRQGQKIKQGQVIGRRGSTGNSTGPHLHFEISSGGRTVNPAPWITDRGPGYGGYDPSAPKDNGSDLN